jgi:predicted nucleotidyltransferase
MGTKVSKTSEALFTKTQRRVLGLLFSHPERSYYANEIVRFARAGIGAVQRELARLVAARLITATKQGNQKHYQADRQSPVFDELVGLVRKTIGTETAGPIGREVGVREGEAAYRTGGRAKARDQNQLEIPYPKLQALCRRYHIKKLSLFGSAARGEQSPSSDVDLMVEFEPGRAPSLWESTDMEADFSALFGGRRVDLVPPSVMRNPYRRKTIQPDLKVLYEAK